MSVLVFRLTAVKACIVFVSLGFSQIIISVVTSVIVPLGMFTLLVNPFCRNFNKFGQMQQTSKFYFPLWAMGHFFLACGHTNSAENP